MLEQLMRRVGTLVVYGPRGVGKSELVRYVLRRGGFPAVRVDARREAAGEIVEVMGLRGRDAGRAARRTVKGLLRLLPCERAAGLVALAEEAWRLLRAALRGERLVIFVDEFHLLPGLGGRPDAAMRELEAAAGLIAKNVDLGVTLVVSVSEGFATRRGAAARLLGYNASWLLVEHLDEVHLRGLHGEYAERHGCALSVDAVL